MGGGGDGWRGGGRQTLLVLINQCPLPAPEEIGNENQMTAPRFQTGGQRR